MQVGQKMAEKVMKEKRCIQDNTKKECTRTNKNYKEKEYLICKRRVKKL